jgi:hypothetical protein
MSGIPKHEFAALADTLASTRDALLTHYGTPEAETQRHLLAQLLWDDKYTIIEALRLAARLPDREEAITAAARYLVQTVERKAWDGTRADGRAKDGGFEPFHWSEWTWGVNGNARQEDYRDVVRKIVEIVGGCEQKG